MAAAAAPCRIVPPLQLWKASQLLLSLRQAAVGSVVRVHEAPTGAAAVLRCFPA